MAGGAIASRLIRELLVPPRWTAVGSARSDQQFAAPVAVREFSHATTSGQHSVGYARPGSRAAPSSQATSREKPDSNRAGLRRPTTVDGLPNRTNRQSR